MTPGWKLLSLEDLQARIERGDVEGLWSPGKWVPLLWWDADEDAPRYGREGVICFGRRDFYERRIPSWAMERDDGLIAFRQRNANIPTSEGGRYHFRPKGSVLTKADFPIGFPSPEESGS
jgi:hypothetical protein